MTANYLERLGSKFSRRNINDKFIAKFRAERFALNAALQLVSAVRVKTQATIGVGCTTSAATWYEVTCLDQANGEQRLVSGVGQGKIDGAGRLFLNVEKRQLLLLFRRGL